MDKTSRDQDQISLGLGLGDSSASESEEIESKPVIDCDVKVEEEAEEAVELAVVGSCGGVSPPLPKPLEGLHEAGPPPFLTKTFEMVDYPETDPIVSWGETGYSFVVWDHHKFATNLLPKYFKHSNFSSFIRQLNTYGFRKVHLDRWEFANAGFQKGKKHLLKTIRRRNHGANNHTRVQQLERQTELEDLKKAQDALKVEIHDLRQQQENSNKCLAAMEERIRFAEWKQRQFVLILAKAMKRTSFLQQLIEHYKQKKALANGEMHKKRRLASSESLENSFLAKGMNQNADTPSEKNSFLGSNSMQQEQSSGLTFDTSSPDLSTGNYIMWEKLMEDDVICDDDEASNKSSYVHELEDLLEKPLTWSSFANVGEVACPIGT
uniref:HSF-type DNA-binding domain-containing protein n=1 Tax=Opuntia streptacantha TaxID=393608 RepID=A0A7C8Z532_OPUST